MVSPACCYTLPPEERAPGPGAKIGVFARGTWGYCRPAAGQPGTAEEERQAAVVTAVKVN